MKPSIGAIRLFFMFLSIVFMMAYVIGTTPLITPSTLLVGLVLGLCLGGFLIVLDLIFRRFSLSAFNTLSLGLFFGALLGFALLLIFNTAIDIASIGMHKEVGEIVKILLFLSASYLGVITTYRYASEVAIAIPFLRLNAQSTKCHDLLLDSSVIIDGRIVDIAATGLLDGRLIIPGFVMKELFEMAESKEESSQSKGIFALEVVKKLELLTTLHLRFVDTDFSDVKTSREKTLRLARIRDCDLLIYEANRVEIAPIDGVHVINLQSLASALKPLMQRGNFLTIKVQRLGKEDRQGVGYLDDGTMVVINGGGDYLGEQVRASVLSVKHTTAGRMIFCNLAEET